MMLRARNERARRARRAARRAWTQPIVAAAIIATIALGMGFVTATAVVARTLLSATPPGLSEPKQLVRLYFRRPLSDGTVAIASSVGLELFSAMAHEVDGFDDVAAYYWTRSAFGRGNDATQVQRGIVSGSFFRTLGVRPALGRVLTNTAAGAEPEDPECVLSYGFWRRQFGSDSSIVGRWVDVGRNRYRVIGVADRNFFGVDPEPMDVWVPLSIAGPEVFGQVWNQPGQALWLNVIARVRGSPSRSQAEATAAFSNILRAVPSELGWSPAKSDDGRSLETVRQPLVIFGAIGGLQAPVATPTVQRATLSGWLTVAAALTFLATCANGSILLIVRALRRRRRLSIEAALGASHQRLYSDVLAEDGVLLLGGGILGAVVAWAATRLLLASLGFESLPAAQHRNFALAAATLLAFVVTAAATLIPVFWITTGHLTQGGTGEFAASPVRRGVLRNSILVLQSALTILLLFCAGLFVASFRSALSVNGELKSDRVVVARLDAGSARLSPPQVLDFYRRAYSRLRTAPGVDRVALTNTAPFRSSITSPVSLPGTGPIRRSEQGPYYNAFFGDYFGVLGVRVARGRGLTEDDASGSGSVAVINETMATSLWPGLEPIGRCFLSQGDSTCKVVVGVVRDIRDRDVRPVATMEFYVPFRTIGAMVGSAALLIRTHDGPHLDALRKELQRVGDGLPYIDVQSLSTVLEPRQRTWRVGAHTLSLFAAVTWIVAMIGLSAVIALDLQNRSREVAVRQAMGATPARALGAAIKASMGLVAVGLGIGGIACVALSSRIAPMLFETRPGDLGALSSVAAVVALGCVLALAGPIARAFKQGPAQVLRSN